MKLRGFIAKRTIIVPTKYNYDLVAETKTFALGGGEWSIEVYDYQGHLLEEFVGLNGTRDDEEATDLWSEYDEWAAQVHEPEHEATRWTAPDGTEESPSFFYKEALRGRLHGLILTL